MGISIGIKWLTAKDGSFAIKIFVSGRLAGKSLDDYMTITTNKGEVKIPTVIKVQNAEISVCCECGKHTEDLIPLREAGLFIRVKSSLPANRQFVCRKCWEREIGAANIHKEPPLLSWCPVHADVVRKKSLFFNKYTQKYECFYGKETYPCPDKRVTDYNNTHP
jgi:hypothetical protein